MAFESTNTNEKKSANTSAAGTNKTTSWMDQFDTGQGGDDDKKNGQYTEEGRSFADLYEQSLTQSDVREGEVVDGVVVNVGPDHVTVDIGYKCEGLVPIEEFRRPDGTTEVKVGDALSVYLERIESDTGFMQL